MRLPGFRVRRKGPYIEVYSKGERIAFGTPEEVKRSYERGEYDPWREDENEVHNP